MSKESTVRLGKTKWGTLQRFKRIKIKGPARKTFRYDIKLIELYVVTKSFWKKVLFLRQHKSPQRPSTCTTIQSTGELTGDPVPALYGKTLLNGTRTPIRYSWVGPGQSGCVWVGNPIEKAGLAGIGCRGQLPQYLSAGYVPHMCGNVSSSRMGKSGSKVGPMRTEKW